MAQWRGLQAGDGIFSAAAVFASLAEQEAFWAACDAHGSNPERPFFRHAVSLLVSESQLEDVLVPLRRAEALADCVEFVLNPRDYPLLATRGLGECALPVLSQYSWDTSDRRLPAAMEDYVRCWPGLRFGRDRRPQEPLPAALPWGKRRACAVFRGGATGAGVTPDTNPRLKLAQLSAQWNRADGVSAYRGLLDARLTGWNLRQKLGDDGVTRLLNPAVAAEVWGIRSAGPWNFLSWQEQARYKYAVYLEGNVGASRLGAMLGLGFVILAPPHVGPCTHLWTLMHAGTHYIELASDLSDLGEWLLWLRSNDGPARRYAKAARELWERACALDYLELRTAQLLSSLPRCEDGSFERGLLELFRKARSGVYCLVNMRLGQLRIFAPFANEAFENEFSWSFEPAPLRAFLAHVKEVSGEAIALPPRRWWTNGKLVCNQAPLEVWGEGLLPQMRLLLERSAARACPV